MEWDVKTVDVYPTKADHSNVIYNVHWRVSKTEGEVEAWVVSAMGKEAVAELEANLDAQIEAQKNPTTETKSIAD